MNYDISKSQNYLQFYKNPHFEDLFFNSKNLIQSMLIKKKSIKY